MLTVKLFRGHAIKIVEAEEVNVFPSGHAEGSEQDPRKRTNEVREIEVSTNNRTQGDAFYVADPSKPRPEGYAECIEFYDSAYIENARGATVEVVRPY